MTTSWALAMGRDDFARTALVYAPMPDLSDGEVRLRVDRVGLSDNNVTYAVLGQPLRYWQFFMPEFRGLAAERGLAPFWVERPYNSATACNAL
jgi:hypothetical protein